MFSFLKKPPPNKVIFASEARTLLVARDKTLLEAMLTEGLAMPHDCKVGSCGTCKFKLLDGKIRELSPSALALERDELLAGYRLACQAIPRSDLTIALDAPLTVQQTVDDYRATIVSVPRLCPDIINLTVELDRPLSFVPGQYADIGAPGVDGLRSYSFAFAPIAGSTRNLQFHVRHVPGGAFTDWLFADDRVGASLTLRAPYGAFHLKQSAAPILCIAGGSGLAPIISILQEALALGATRPVTLLYGARTRTNLYCLDEIGRLKATWRGPFDFIPVLSDEAADSPWQGARGPVTQQIAELPIEMRYEAYLCGPPAMVDLAEAELLEAGLAPDAISADRFVDRSDVR
ncbi:2Fe-2S iron-sulfur cluster binding domain-containing protein [Sphingobium sp. AS12]|uniref:2Fe-2S iron-sulfur cluster-binding protein n=1 Tax=Sphingobium sp. AS12 TaxID=2849495 RepID=UPI001C312002|nr:2Fe-2S iron-sulfur cluster binding domain-containing protein [Sphingobium sp. AS12]MBV2148245.1 2Fe-2S iron-sulfur cluster binding domain-containing protein [Sphingobium sp. AS12]